MNTDTLARQIEAAIPPIEVRLTVLVIVGIMLGIFIMILYIKISQIDELKEEVNTKPAEYNNPKAQR